MKINFLKKAVAISLLFVFVFNNTDIGQILKLPVLVRHFVEHNHKAKKITFLTFLNEHYFTSQNHPDNSKHDHQNSPFKTCSSHCTSAFLAIKEQNVYTEQAVNSIKSNNAVPLYRQYYTSNLFGAIWQPPKLI